MSIFDKIFKSKDESLKVQPAQETPQEQVQEEPAAVSPEAPASEEQSAEPAANVAASSVLPELLRNLNCTYTIENRSHSDYYKFDFQGGHFRIDASKGSTSVWIEFPGIVTVDAERLNVIRICCNEMNFKARFCKFAYSFIYENNQVAVHIFTPYNLYPAADGTYSYFADLLQMHFDMARDFRQTFEDALKKTENQLPTDLEMENLRNAHFLSMLSEQELSHQDKPEGWRATAENPLTMGYVIDFFYNEGANFTSMMVITDHVSVISGAEAVRAYHLMEDLIEGQGAEAKLATGEVVLVLRGQNETLTLQLTVKVETASAIYFRVNLMCPGMQTNAHNQMGLAIPAHSFVIVYDKVSEENHKAEFEYMWEDAKAKLKANKLDELTECQQLICDTDKRNLAIELYWGRKYYHQKRYYEALYHLELIYNQMNADFHHLSDELKEKFYNVCFLIGYSYNELRQYAKAYFYLDIVFHLNRLIETTEYVNCMVNAKDFRAIYIINTLLESIPTEEGGEDEEEDEEEENAPQPEMDKGLQAFKAFLTRRKAYVLIDLGYWDEAEKLCKEMLQDPQNADFALSELAYLQGLKEQSSAEDKETK